MAKIKITYDWDAIKADPVEFARKWIWVLIFSRGYPKDVPGGQHW